MESATLGRAVIQRVVRELGGIDAAAARLRTTPFIIKCLSLGTARVPDEILLRAVDILLDDLQGAGPITRRPVNVQHEATER